MTELEASRRHLITGLAMAGVAVPVLAACGDGGSDGTSSSTAPVGGIKTSDIPVGGGKIYKSDKIVVTQPDSGDFKAFSAVCTHQGCLVSKVASGTIDCSCHGSKYSIEDGSVQDGPAPKPLPEKTVTVSGDTLSVS
jgi:Rieske Fe-S protein